MNLFDFLHEHPIMGFFLAVIVLHFPVSIIRALKGTEQED